MLDLQVYEHNDIEDLSAFEIQFEKGPLAGKTKRAIVTAMMILAWML